MCAQGQTPAHGVCYNPPNRVAVTFPLTAGAGSANPYFTGVLTTGDVIEVQMVLGSAFSGDNMQWSWANCVRGLWEAAHRCRRAGSIGGGCGPQGRKARQRHCFAER